VDVAWRVGPREVDLIWRDNGTGIPADVAERLFDPYFSTKSKGTGLGLAICRNLLDKMGGRITLTNRDDTPGAQAVLTFLRADVVPDEESA
jgi:nitrogen fixation/metabolism regulation signal transduction histidine kinase